MNTTASGARTTVGRWIRIALGLAIAAGVVWYAEGHQDELRPLRALSIPILSIVLVVRVANGLLQNQTMLLLLRVFGPVSFWELILLNTGATFANLLAPFAGASLKAVYLARQHQIRFAELAGAMGAMGAIRISISGVAALVGMAAILALDGAVSREAWLLAIMTSLLGALIIFAAAPIGRLLARFPIIGSVAAAFVQLSKDRRLAGAVIALTALRAITGFCAFGLLTWAVLPSPHSFWIGGSMGSIATTLEILKVTPGNLGSYEALAALAGGALGMSSAIGLAIAALSRIMGYASTLILALVALVARRGP